MATPGWQRITGDSSCTPDFLLARLRHLLRNHSDNKGHNGFCWFWADLLFGPLGLVAVAALSDRKQRRYIRQIAEKQGVKLPPESDD